MSKVKYEETFGLWGYQDEKGSFIDDCIGVKFMPMCPKCNEPTYNQEKCPFCRRKIRV